MKLSTILVIAALPATTGYAFVTSTSTCSRSTFQTTRRSRSTAAKSNLQMVDQNVLMGAGIAFAGTAAGIALVVFTENQGERSKERGVGISSGMTTKIAGKLMEDIEIDNVGDMGSLTSKLENALKQSGGVDDKWMKENEMTDEEKKRVADDLDDGW